MISRMIGTSAFSDRTEFSVSTTYSNEDGFPDPCSVAGLTEIWAPTQQRHEKHVDNSCAAAYFAQLFGASIRVKGGNMKPGNSASPIEAIALLLAFSTVVWGQTGTSSVRGTIADQQNSMIAGASVNLTNAATSAVRTQRTGPTGTFSFDLRPSPLLLFLRRKRELTSFLAGSIISAQRGESPGHIVFWFRRQVNSSSMQIALKRLVS